MAKNLVIVESPFKARTIEKYLGKNYKVLASVGHVRDLPKSQMGIDLENNFEPKYITIRGKGPVIAELKKEQKKADRVLIATDPDREGEAIAWHLATALDLDKEEAMRVSFQEITKEAVKEAIKKPVVIDQGLVDAQQARRILDRLVGYGISPILWRKVMKGLSAGRVQSVATRLIILREREISAFIPKEYWLFDGKFLTSSKKLVDAELIKYKNKKLEVSTKEEAMEIKKEIQSTDFSVTDIQEKKRSRAPYGAYTTSTLQQDASVRLNFSSSKTMMLAQRLYEGIKIGRSTEGLITYMRTDSARISESAVLAAKDFIVDNYGSKYSAPKIGGAAKAAQDAHEAIRPTSVEHTPEKMASYLKRDELRLYTLIWTRFVASQMKSAQYEGIQVTIAGGDYEFRAKGERQVFDGFLKVYDDRKSKDVELAPMEIGEEMTLNELKEEQKFTQPPSRYTEASLIKELEENGIGRPSTYAPTLTAIMKRGYVVKEKKNLLPTELGEITNEIMEENFLQIVEPEFSAEMEEELDKISDKSTAWQEVIGDFYGVLKPMLEEAEKSVQKYDLDELTDIKCEKCGSPMLIKKTVKGSFYACSNYPECQNTKPILKEIGVPCPLCEKGQIVERKTKKLKVFWGCDQFPDCRFASWDKPINRMCPKCGSILVEGKGKRSGTIHCSSKECDYTEKKDKKKGSKA
ncbi:MAG: type I DNA topoisomerase [Tissierellia bacterium]|nr:type I DNA topoisomerase [Tissierellia bacterium]